eukprot:467886-Rhodomonas_salina.5
MGCSRDLKWIGDGDGDERVLSDDDAAVVSRRWILQKHRKNAGDVSEHAVAAGRSKSVARRVHVGTHTRTTHCTGSTLSLPNKNTSSGLRRQDQHSHSHTAHSHRPCSAPTATKTQRKQAQNWQLGRVIVMRHWHRHAALGLGRGIPGVRRGDSGGRSGSA